jgi:hypothetical protein
MTWLRVSLAAQAILALYFQVIQWFSLSQWNFQPQFRPFVTQVARGEATPAELLFLAAFTLPFLLFWFACARQIRWLMWVGVAGYSAWLAMQVKSWWVPYAFGASDAWLAVHRRVFSHSTQVLPSFGRHVPPDGMHLVLQLLLAIVVVSAIAGLRKTARPSLSRER